MDPIIAVEMMVVHIEQGRDRSPPATFACSPTAFPTLAGTLITRPRCFRQFDAERHQYDSDARGDQSIDVVARAAGLRVRPTDSVQRPDTPTAAASVCRDLPSKHLIGKVFFHLAGMVSWPTIALA
ncbi:MAG: hypothetical protein AW11_02633 [Candidatus Accumulibacter regalis]|jgi:hypothetical protein|uniref:Uncharacterized protein n=2 Tax=Candidatus Accumulibacter TaxID=327159 RepID=A0A011NXV2_ACCRE|nr:MULTISPECIES: hypothetical protein [unclassified Candidatus Accumulibacter]EXI87503.1 MAG: hypothetical protein AW11_02633 [Candidatus Accumulibacter regalis]HRE70788.1 hypothetical protein [Accumulibacter sp.]HRE85889.1 hypothetical protein [Accumulibacter sp.]